MNEKYYDYLIDLIFSKKHLRNRVIESTTKDMFIMANCADNWQYIKQCSFYGRVSDKMIEDFGNHLNKRWKEKNF